jgi:sensor c-di-GMP phosphodiesterase-like protein
MSIRLILTTWKRLWRAGYPTLLLFTLLGISVVLFGAHLLRMLRDRADLQQYVQTLLNHSTAVANAGTDTLQQVQKLQSEACSPADIAELRYLVFQSRLLRDIGRLQQGRLLCTASWGVLEQPKPMPLPNLQVYGRLLWSGVGNLLDPRIFVDMAASGDVVVVTSPAAFDNFLVPPKGVGTMVTTKDGQHIFQNFGDYSGMAPFRAEAWYNIGDSRYAFQCANYFDICVSGRHRTRNLFAQSPWLTLSLCLMGGLAGSSIGMQLTANARHRGSPQMQLRRALLNDGLEVYYQPLRRLRDRQLVGAESLARWCNEDGEWVSPEQFVPMAAQMQLGGTLTRQIVRKALQQMQPWLVKADDFYISLNLSAADIIDPSFHEYLDDQVRQHGIACARIVLELTERSTTGQAELARGIDTLRSKGYHFYVDDFGTGYSSVAYLAELSVDAIKIDRMFTQSIGTGSPVELIIEPMCAMAARLQLDLVVEGIETEQQAAFVLNLAPNALGQGWLLGRPMSFERFPLS